MFRALQDLVKTQDSLFALQKLANNANPTVTVPETQSPRVMALALLWRGLLRTIDSRDRPPTAILFRY